MPNKKKKHARNENADLNEREGTCCDQQGRATTKECPPNGDTVMTDDVLGTCFSNGEVKTMKNLFKTSDLRGIPLIIGATVLNKLDMISDLINGGVNVNEVDQHKATALVWAIKNKHLESVDKLLSSGADVKVQSPNGDHIVFIALDSKTWDEDSFIFLWNRINEVALADCNLLNKSGNSMVHIAVRREWFLFLDILIDRGIDVDISNFNGVTPLMLASYRNNLDMLNKFISKGADLKRQDCNGFFPICYAFSSAITKHIRPPNLVVDRLLDELQKEGFSLEDYIQKRTAMILNCTNVQQQHNGQPISIILLHILMYIIRYNESGLKVLLDMNIFQMLKKVAWKCAEYPDRLKTMLTFMYELLVYSEFCTKPKIQESELSCAYETSGCANLCLEVTKRYESDKNYMWILPIAFRTLLQACLIKGRTQEWLQSNLDDMHHCYEQVRSMDLQSIKTDDKELVLTQEKLDRFEAFLNQNLLSNDTIYPKTNIESDEQETCSAHELKPNSKKAKRRTKALKAKIAKIKSADLTERLNSTGKKLLVKKQPPQIVEATETVREEDPIIKEEDNTFLDDQKPSEIIEDSSIVDSIKQNLFIGNESESEMYYEHKEKRLGFPKADWKSQILNLPFNSKLPLMNHYEDDFCFKPDELKFFMCPSSTATTKLTEDNVEEILYPAIKYLKILVNKIIRKYQKYWEIDKELEKESKNIHKDKNSNKEDNPEQNTILEKLEKEKIDLLCTEFDNVISYLKEVALKDMVQCRSLMKNVEKILLSHEIRGTTIIAEICPMETIFVSVSIPENLEIPSANNAENALTKYMEDVLSNRRDPIENINITVTEPKHKHKNKIYMSDDMLYMKEMAALPKAKRINSKMVLDAQKKTLKSAYHIQPLISEACDDAEEDLSKSKDVDFDDYEPMSKTMMFFNKTAYQNRSELLFSETFVDPLRKSESDTETSRWCTLVRSLEMMEDCQEFLGGRVRISCKEKRQSHVISTGGNFTPVELGLESCDRPLAVKRIPKGSCVCEMIKTMLADLLSLRHNNLLYYFTCEYDNNELIIATPLCEYNVGQYLMLMKQNQTNLTALEVVKQFLTGLLFLHNRTEPIVHGNLKPSNIFVDINGVVKIAEFGIHRALFKFKEAPNSSIIWFATETYRTFKQLSIMECTSASDIQVAGMLVHFLMTAGKHPYGDDMRIILKNLDKAVPQLSANDLELEDLITWMLLYDPIERPSIQQVVTHVYFWSPERKWRFILTCAGLGSKTGNPSFKLDELHVCLEKVAFKDNIKGKWVQVVKQQFPKISFANNDDTPTGLLKFIRACMDSKDPLCFHTDLNLSDYILTSFPAFALSLYRMLENSVWVKHSTFSKFYSVDNIFT